MNGLRDCGVVGIGTTDVTRVSESAAHKIKVVLLGRLALNRDEKRNKSQVGECMRGVPQYAADNMVKVRVADLRFVAFALLLLASLTTTLPVRKNPPWHNPCDITFTGKTRRQVSHPRIKSKGPLVTTLKNARDEFCDEWTKVASIYNPIEDIKKPFDNLPSNTLTWYRKDVHPMKINLTLPKFHIDLQKFFIGLESMKETDDLLIRDNKIRDNFFQKVSDRAKLLLCEVETFLNRSKLRKPDPENEYGPCLEEFDQGTAVILGCEKSFFSLYNTFLDDWNTIFDKNSKNNSKGCVNNREIRKGKRENKKTKNSSRAGHRKRHKDKKSVSLNSSKLDKSPG